MIGECLQPEPWKRITFNGIVSRLLPSLSAEFHAVSYYCNATAAQSLTHSTRDTAAAAADDDDDDGEMSETAESQSEHIFFYFTFTSLLCHSFLYCSVHSVCLVLCVRFIINKSFIINKID